MIRLPNIPTENRCDTHCGPGSATQRRASYLLHPVSVEKKEKCLQTFVSASDALVPARAIIFLPISHCIRASYIPPPNHTYKRDSSKFGLLRELSKYYLSYSCTILELCAFSIDTWQDADRFCFEISLWASFFSAFYFFFFPFKT